MEEFYLIEALKLAEKARGVCAPNPAVGALVVKEGRILATGYHKGPGLAHAEREALRALEDALGADLYVTLEPCCHLGKTPPCTDLIIEKKVSRVFYGCSDPNPIVYKKGEATLNTAGIFCKQVAIQAIDDFYEAYTHWTKYHRPFVTAKLAMTLDGKIAGVGGERVRISGEKADIFTHKMRRRADACLTTAKTIQKDNPRLDARQDGKTLQKPVYVLDRTLSLSLSSQIFETSGRLTIFHLENISEDKRLALRAKKATCIGIPSSVDFLEKALDVIANHGVHDLWIEAGGRMFESLVSKGLLQRAFLYISPKWFGEGTSAFNGRDIFKSTRSVRWSFLGADALCEIRW